MKMAKAAAPSGGPRLTCETSERNAEALKTNKDLEKKNVAIVNDGLDPGTFQLEPKCDGLCTDFKDKLTSPSLDDGSMALCGMFVNQTFTFKRNTHVVSNVGLAGRAERLFPDRHFTETAFLSILHATTTANLPANLPAADASGKDGDHTRYDASTWYNA